MRLSGVAASIATFAMLFIVYSVYSNWDSVTMGVSSIIGLPMYVTPHVAFVCAAITVICAYLFQISSFGLLLRAAREDDIAAKACGIRIYWVRVLAFTVSGFFMGIAGVLYGHYLGTIGVDTFFLELTFLLLAMLIVGGQFSLTGAVTGVIALSAVVELLRILQSGISFGSTQYSIPNGAPQIILAVIMLCILVFRRDGITHGREIVWPFRRRPL
jgi:branched-chain amino acid transport system permease protein